jgi:hypothetical protein
MGAAAAAEQGLRVRDVRRANWFWVENVLVDVFQPVLGPLASAVYQTLVREAGRSRRVRTRLEAQQVDLTLREIGELSGVSKDTASRLLRKMVRLRMLGEKTDGKRMIYELYDLQDAAEPGIAGLQRILGEAPPAKPTVARSERGLTLFDDGEEEQGLGVRDKGLEDTHADEIRDAENNHGQGPQLVSQRDKIGDDPAKGLSHEPGGLVSPSGDSVSQGDSFVSHGDPVSIQEEKTKTEDHYPPNPPASGRALEPLSVVLDGIARLRPRQGDVSDLREQIAEHMSRAGFMVERDAHLPDRGDGRAGTLELSCVRLSAFGGDWVAIEVDGMLPRDKSVTKLRRFEGTRVLVLRTASLQASPAGSFEAVPGIDHVIRMGWPGNGAAERNEVALARTRVGMAAPVARAAEGIREPSATTVREVLAAVREQIAGTGPGGARNAEELAAWEAAGGNEYLAEWDQAFAGVSYERHELAEASSDGILLVVNSPDPYGTQKGLAQYEVRLSREMERVFGARVHVQVVGKDFYAGGDSNGE